MIIVNFLKNININILTLKNIRNNGKHTMKNKKNIIKENSNYKIMSMMKSKKKPKKKSKKISKTIPKTVSKTKT